MEFQLEYVVRLIVYFIVPAPRDSFSKGPFLQEMS
jgi:hypothetical protein